MEMINNTQTSPPPNGGGKSGSTNSLISGAIGGAIVAAVFAVLLATGVINGKQTTVVQQAGGNVSTSTTNASDVKTVNQIYKDSAAGVVSIKTKVRTGSNDLFGQTQEGTATGSGVVIDKNGYIITNAHVVENNEGAPTVSFSNDTTVTAKVVGTDPSNDIAVLKVNVDSSKLKPIPLGDSSKVEVGDPVVAIGNPFGLNRTVTTGIVSALQRQISAPNNFTISNVIQTDAAINPGNSGGPLLDSDGNVIGINSQIATSGTSDGSVGIGFAIPINTVKGIIPQLEKSGKVDYAYLGVSTATLTSDLASHINYDGHKTGAVVACVVKNGPADKAGLTAGSDTADIGGEQTTIDGDLIIAINGATVNNSEQVANDVTSKKSGDTIKITVVRDGKEKTLPVKLGTRPTTLSNNCSQQSQEPTSP